MTTMLTMILMFEHGEKPFVSVEKRVRGITSDDVGWPLGSHYPQRRWFLQWWLHWQW